MTCGSGVVASGVAACRRIGQVKDIRSVSRDCEGYEDRDEEGGELHDDGLSKCSVGELGVLVNE
jgi:hypothetical protein